MAEPTSTNPTPSQNVDLSGFLPSEDEVERAQQEQLLKSHAHMVAIYYDALLEAGVNFHLAEMLIQEWSSDTLISTEQQDERD